MAYVFQVYTLFFSLLTPLITILETSEHFMDIVCQCFVLFIVEINRWKQCSSKQFTTVSSAEEGINQDTRSIKDVGESTNVDINAIYKWFT